MKTALVIVVFLVGCVTGGVASQVVAPPARAGADHQKWEYWCFGANPRDSEDIQEKSNSAGPQGWEMATATGGVGPGNTTYCFKRPTQPR